MGSHDESKPDDTRTDLGSVSNDNKEEIDIELAKSIEKLVEEETNVAKAAMGKQEIPVRSTAAGNAGKKDAAQMKTQVLPDLVDIQLQARQAEKEKQQKSMQKAAMEKKAATETKVSLETQVIEPVKVHPGMDKPGNGKQDTDKPETDLSKKTSKTALKADKKKKILIVGIVAAVTVAVIAGITVWGISNRKSYSYNYQKAMELLKKQDYHNAKQYFAKAYQTGEGKKNVDMMYALYQCYQQDKEEQQALDMLLFNMHKLLPSPQHDAAILAENASGEPVELHCDENEPTAAYVFKTVADPFVGKLSYLRVISGKVTGGAALVNARTGETEKIGKPLTVIGKKQTETDGIGAGDIGAVAKLVSAKTGDTLCDASRVVKLPAAAFPLPSLFMAVTVAKKGDEGKISSALARLMEEDPTLSYINNAETHQQIIGGLGEQHLDVVKAKLKNKFGVEIGLEAPRIAYRESIRKACQKQGRHKKQTGGHGQFGDVVINFEPCDSEQVVFEEKVFGGSVPKNFFPAVEKGVRLAAEKGVLAGYPVVGLKATLLDGSYHPVDSSEMAFIMAAKLAYKAAMPEAGPVILEPIHTLKAHVPNDNTGDIMGDVTKRRGRVLGMEPDEDGMQTVIAEVPLAELSNFTTFIRQITQGRGWFTTEFARYEILPEMLVPAVVEQAKKLGNLDEGAED